MTVSMHFYEVKMLTTNIIMEKWIKKCTKYRQLISSIKKWSH